MKTIETIMLEEANCALKEYVQEDLSEILRESFQYALEGHFNLLKVGNAFSQKIEEAIKLISPEELKDVILKDIKIK